MCYSQKAANVEEGKNRKYFEIALYF